MKTLILAVALMTSALPALAGDEALASKAGYLDFSVLAADYGEPRVSINLGSSLLRLVSVMQHDDPVAEAALRNLESIRVNVYDTHGDSMAAEDRMAIASKALAAASWEQIVRVREPEKRVDIYVKHDDEVVNGVAVMSVDDEEAVFINILGEINPEELSMVMDTVDMDVDIDLDL